MNTKVHASFSKEKKSVRLIALYLRKKRNLLMTFEHNSSSLIPQRKEKCTLQCVLSSEIEKSSQLWPFSSTCFMLFPCASVIKWTGLPLIVFSFHLLDYNEDGDIMCWFCGREVWIEHSDDFHLFNQEWHLRMQFLRGRRSVKLLHGWLLYENKWSNDSKLM